MNFYKMHFEWRARDFGFKIETQKDLQDFIDFYRNFCLQNLGAIHPQDAHTELQIMEAEYSHLANGGIIVIDEEMAEAFARTDIDNINVEDIYFPFRSVELAIPESICERFGIMPLFVLSSPTKNPADGQYYYSSYIRQIDDSLTPSPNYHKSTNLLISSKNENWYIAEQIEHLQRLDQKTIGLMEESSLKNERSWKFFLVVMLYLQSKDAEKALEEISIRTLNQTAESSGVKKMRKKCKSYKLVNILSRKNIQYVGHTGRHHASQEAHWVRGYMQYFKHERYYRNPNGSIKTHWVLPYPRGEGKEELDMRAKRALTA